MTLTKIAITLGFIAFTALILDSPAVAQTCPPDQRKEFVLTAVDKDGAAIENLKAEHLSLKIGGSFATISDVVFNASAPLDLAVLIDTSVSQEGVLPRAKVAARALIASVAKQGHDRVAIVSFADKPVYLQRLSSDLSGITPMIDRIEVEIPPGYVGGGVVISTSPPKVGSLSGSTSLWDTVRSATTELFGSEPDNRRRAVLLFTDGVDTSSSSKLKPVIEEAINQGVEVFAIGLVGFGGSDTSEQDMKRLSEQTGGVARFPGKKTEKLEAALTEIAKRLRGRYVVGYCGGATKERAKVQVEVIDPDLRKAKPVLVYKRVQH
jgi:VWFA-related protein